MRRIFLIIFCVLHVSNLSGQDNNTEAAAAAAAVVGAAAIVGAVVAEKDRIKRYEAILERRVVNHLLDVSDIKKFALSGYRLTKENERKFDPSEVDIKIFGLTTYNDDEEVIDKFAILNILSYGWWDVASPTFDIFDYYLITKDEWSEILTAFLDMSSYADINQELLEEAIYVPKSKKREFEKYDLSDSNVKGYYINDNLVGLFILNSENKREIVDLEITKKGVEYKKDDVLLFKNSGSKKYDVYDYSDNFKIIYTNRSLGIFIKSTGELVVLDEDAINAISNRFK